MLEQLLAEIRQGGMLPPKTLAERLNVSPIMVEMMLEDLERRGLLRQLDLGCATSCSGCAAANLCTGKGSEKSRVWMLAG